ncbi:DUF177 domain-containing protein [Elusimicrobiota bacterium]
MTLIFNVNEILENKGLTFNSELDDAGAIDKDLKSENAGIEYPIKVSIEISIGKDDFLMLGTVSGSFNIGCSRCLKKFAMSFSRQIEEIYPLTLETINAGDEVRQAIILSLPEKPVCKPDCKDLCSNCGNDLNNVSCKCNPPTAKPFANLERLKKELEHGKSKKETH